MKIVVVGAGEVGRFLCQTLSENGHDVIVVEASEETAHEVDEAADVRVVEGNGTSANLLKKAGVDGCDFFLAMTSDDRTNLISTSLAKVLGAKVTIARIHDQTYSDNSLVNYQLHFGIDFLINPEALSAVVLAKAIRHPGRVAVENFARGEIEVQQVTINAKSKMVGKTLREMRLGKGVYIGLIQRQGNAEVASPDLALEAEDSITLFGHTDSVNEARLKFQPRSRSDIIRVVLFGGSETAIGLVRLLKNPRFKIRIVEGDPKLCQQLAERFPHVTIINGSATSLRLMEEEQVGSADYFVACTKNDEVNIMTCLQARKLGAQHVQLVINKPDYEDVLDDLRETLGVELAVAPRTATVDEVMRYISREASQELMELPAGAGKIMEFRIAADSPIANKAIRDMPAGAVVVVLMHKFQAKLPAADDVILAGDRLVVIVREDRIKAITDLLT